MPSSLQYPVERLRDVEGRWGRLLQRTATPVKRASLDAFMWDEAVLLVRPVQLRTSSRPRCHRETRR